MVPDPPEKILSQNEQTTMGASIELATALFLHLKRLRNGRLPRTPTPLCPSQDTDIVGRMNGNQTVSDVVECTPKTQWEET